MTGVPGLLNDLVYLMEDRDSADILFLIGKEESPIYAHRSLLIARCKNFQKCTRGEICRIPGGVILNPASVPVSIALPACMLEAFNQVTFYIYTGKIMLQDEFALDVLYVTYELGMDDLGLSTEEHIRSSLVINNVSSYLTSAVDVLERTGGSFGKKYVDQFVRFIGDNAKSCVKTASFLNMSKSALIALLSSDHLAMEEEDVWRTVLIWAKKQAGVAEPTSHWTEEQRKRVCVHLSDVIRFVRLLLIDSQVFAEEVEPTGAVPVELSLERYRFAALPNKFSEQEDRRIQPRTNYKLFPGSKILGGDKTAFQQIINSWIGNEKRNWRLLYQASTHGYGADIFHRRCDGISPSVVIVQGSNGSVCGGYSDVAWCQGASKGRYMTSDKAFLFTLINTSDMAPTTFPVKKRTFAISHHPDYGPIFGAGADFCISNNCNMNMDSYSNLPHSYDGDKASCTVLMGDYYFTVTDYEVYTAA